MRAAARALASANGRSLTVDEVGWTYPVTVMVSRHCEEGADDIAPALLTVLPMGRKPRVTDFLLHWAEFTPVVTGETTELLGTANGTVMSVATDPVARSPRAVTKQLNTPTDFAGTVAVNVHGADLRSTVPSTFPSRLMVSSAPRMSLEYAGDSHVTWSPRNDRTGRPEGIIGGMDFSHDANSVMF